MRCEECTIFLNPMFRRPMLLQCGHSYCKACILSVKVKSICCKVCKKNTTINYVKENIDLTTILMNIFQRHHLMILTYGQECYFHGKRHPRYCSKCSEMICSSCYPYHSSYDCKEVLAPYSKRTEKYSQIEALIEFKKFLTSLKPQFDEEHELLKDIWSLGNRVRKNLGKFIENFSIQHKTAKMLLLNFANGQSPSSEASEVREVHLPKPLEDKCLFPQLEDKLTKLTDFAIHPYKKLINIKLGNDIYNFHWCSRNGKFCFYRAGFGPLKMSETEVSNFDNCFTSPYLWSVVFLEIDDTFKIIFHLERKEKYQTSQFFEDVIKSTMISILHHDKGYQLEFTSSEVIYNLISSSMSSPLRESNYEVVARQQPLGTAVFIVQDSIEDGVNGKFPFEPRFYIWFEET